MQDSSKKKEENSVSHTEVTAVKKEYIFGGIQEYSLEKIENEILNESLYLDVFAGSDLAFKENVHDLENILPSLMTLSCISYKYKNNEFQDKNFPESRQIGVVAQEVQKFFPELVQTDKNGLLHVNYSQLSTVALQGIKELGDLLVLTHERMDRLEAEVNRLSKSNS